MLSNYLYQLAAAAVFVGAAFFSGLITGRDYVQDKWDAARATQTQAAFAAERNARAKEQILMTQLAEAQNAATLRETKLRADYAAAHAAANSLRHTIATIGHGLPTSTADANRQTAAAALAVFSDCSATVEQLAATADGHASDVQTLTDAWPK